MAQIIIESMSFYYKEYFESIFEDVNLNLDSNWKLGLIGRNGRGKTTLLRLLHGELLPELDIAFSYQEPILKGGYPKDYFNGNHLYWYELCLSFDLPHNFLARPIETFSNGEIKKMEMARALSLPNHILFLDEPLNYMDIYFCKQLEEAITEYKPTVVFVEHDERFGETVANRIIEL